MTIRFEHFSGAIDDRAIHLAFNRFDNELIAEEDPSLGSRPVAETAAMLSQEPSHERRLRWLAMDGDAVVGSSVLYLDDEDTANLHLGWVDVGVSPAYRRRGIGTRFVEAVATAALESNRTKLMMDTNSLVPSGGEFMAKLGAEVGLVEGVNQLDMAELDRGLMQEWADRGRAQSDRFELIRIDGPWPDEMIDEVVALSHVMNDAPVGDLDFNDQVLTAAHVIEYAEELAERNVTRLILVVRDIPSGRLAGYSDLAMNPSFPDLGQQGDTGVFPEFRGHGLGKWLKSEMVLRLADEFPHITRIWTENAHSNAPMLAINHAMGFKLHHEQTIWQIESQAALDALRGW